MEFQRMSGSGFPCGACDLIWCPFGDHEKMFIRLTVRDCLSLPVASCQVRLDLSGAFDPNEDLPSSGNGRICGAASRTATTNANGAVQFPIYGGGAGRYAIRWEVTALCSDPEIELAIRDDTLCIKSFDFDGSGAINFADTFRFAPMLVPGVGYSGDFRSCSDANIVNYMDTIIYAPHLSGSHACAGGAGQSFLLTKPSGGIPPDCDDLF